MVKLLIIEGCDRTSKNTLIKNLTSQYENYVVRHFGSPNGKNNFEIRSWQYNSFKKEFDLASKRNDFSLMKEKGIWIWNRSHIGEAIYGKMYRNTNPDDWIYKLESSYNFHIDPQVYLLLMEAPAEFLCKRDDGLSFTSDVEKKKDELGLFRSAYDDSLILNKQIIDVSNGNEYLDQVIILDKVNKFLNNETRSNL